MNTERMNLNEIYLLNKQRGKQHSHFTRQCSSYCCCSLWSIDKLLVLLYSRSIHTRSFHTNKKKNEIRSIISVFCCWFYFIFLLLIFFFIRLRILFSYKFNAHIRNSSRQSYYHYRSYWFPCLFPHAHIHWMYSWLRSSHQAKLFICIVWGWETVHIRYVFHHICMHIINTQYFFSCSKWIFVLVRRKLRNKFYAKQKNTQKGHFQKKK